VQKAIRAYGLKGVTFKQLCMDLDAAREALDPALRSLQKKGLIVPEGERYVDVQTMREAAKDREVQTEAQRKLRAAYRQAETDPYIMLRKKFLPREGAAERSTQKSQAQVLKSLDGLISYGSSDPKTHAWLNKTPGQRRTALATMKRRERGAVSAERVRELWEKFSDVPKHERAGRIAHELDVRPPYVRRLLKTILPSR
jgi:DNA-binding MarR family transcriptional regulator